MLKRSKTIISTNTTNTINKQFVSNPINSIFEKVQKIDFSHDLKARAEKISEIVDYIHLLSDKELLNLMSNENEIIRNLAARSYVDNSDKLSIGELEKMLKDENEFLRDSAITALCYINSDETLNLLKEATKDTSKLLKMKAITGIADIASEHSNSKAKEILRQFLNDKNDEIKQFVTDELSFLRD